MSRAEAVRRLTVHWNEQVKLFPSMIQTKGAPAFLVEIG